MFAFEQWFVSVRPRLENQKDVSVSFSECWDAATKTAEEKFKFTNSAITKCKQCEHYNNESLADICSGCCHMYISRFTLRK